MAGNRCLLAQRQSEQAWKNDLVVEAWAMFEAFALCLESRYCPENEHGQGKKALT